MYIPFSHFDLALMTTPRVAQQSIRRPLLVPKAESPQDKSPPDMPAHEIGAFCEVRKSNDPFNTTWCWPRSSELHSELFCPALLCHPPSPHLPHYVYLCAFLPRVWVPTARPSATANQLCFAEIHQPRELLQLTQDEASGALRGRAVFVPYLCPD